MYIHTQVQTKKYTFVLYLLCTCIYILPITGYRYIIYQLSLGLTNLTYSNLYDIAENNFHYSIVRMWRMRIQSFGDCFEDLS